MADRHLLEFGPYRFDPVRRVLWRGKAVVAVPLKDLETLQVLLENPGAVVSKEELLEKVWPGTFIEEANIARHVSNLRAVLAEESDGLAFIETIPKRGYRFVAPVSLVAQNSAALTDAGHVGTGPATAAGTQMAPAPAVLPGTERARRRWPWLIFPVLAIVAFVVIWRLAHPGRPTPKRLVVLPVQNLSGHPERDYITDGLTEEMISRLGELNPQELAVIARTTSMSYRNTTKTVEQIGRELKADYVLESSLRESSGTYRITIQLIRPSDQTHFWAHDYETGNGDVLAVQKQVALAVAQQIRITLPSNRESPSRTYPNDPRAYDAYLKGRFFWNKRTPDSLATSVKFFQQAIEIDPNYAAAYAGLADAYNIQVWFEQLKPEDGFAKSKAAALKAVSLDEELAEAHASLALIYGDWEWNWKTAEVEFQRALQLNPNYATAHHWYAEILAGEGRFSGAMAEIKKAQETDPLSPVIGATVGEMYCRMDQCQQAVEQYRKVLEMHPGFPQAQYLLAEAYARMGDYQHSVEEVGNAQKLPHLTAGWSETTLGYAAGMSGHRQEALQSAERLKQGLDPQHSDYFLAVIYAALGDKDQAFEKLNNALNRRDFSMTTFQADYRLANLRSDARYKALLRRMNLAE